MCFSTSKAFCPLQLQTFYIYRKCKNNLGSFLGQFKWCSLARLWKQLSCVGPHILLHTMMFLYTILLTFTQHLHIGVILRCIWPGFHVLHYPLFDQEIRQCALCLRSVSDLACLCQYEITVHNVWSSLLGKTILYYFISTGGVRVDSAIIFHHQLLSCRATDTPMGQRMTHRDRPLWGESNSTMEDGWLARHTRGITNTGELWIIHCYTSSHGNICIHGF